MSEYDSAPFAPLARSLNRTKVGLVSSGGVFAHGQEPFDFSLRTIPMDAPFDQLQLNHNYFDHRDAVKD